MRIRSSRLCSSSEQGESRKLYSGSKHARGERPSGRERGLSRRARSAMSAGGAVREKSELDIAGAALPRKPHCKAIWGSESEMIVWEGLSWCCRDTTSKPDFHFLDRAAGSAPPKTKTINVRWYEYPNMPVRRTRALAGNSSKIGVHAQMAVLFYSPRVQAGPWKRVRSK